MADDFGDDAGDKLLDWSIRLIIEQGRSGAHSQSQSFAQALHNAQGQIREQAGDAATAGELAEQEGWAKLDLHEFTGIEGWDDLKGVLGSAFEEHGLAYEWFDDEQDGKQYLLFRTADAPELADTFGAVAEKVEAAHLRAVEVIERSRGIERGGRSPGGHDDPDRAAGADNAKNDPRRSMTLREKAAAVRAYAQELSGGGRDGRAPERRPDRDRQRD